MRIPNQSRESGIAMIIVMIVILVLGILAGGFAYSMKVETKLARNGSFEPELEWLGRSGVELAKYVVAQQLMIPTERWDALNQKWAGGPMGTNEALAAISLDDNELGDGRFSIQIIDLERKFNLNMINPNNGNIAVLEQALLLAGTDQSLIQTITDSYLDWLDNYDGDATHPDGAESADYVRMPNPGFAPYMAKNGWVDDVTELLMVRGITPEVFWGPGRAADENPVGPYASGMTGTAMAGPVGLADLFTSMSMGLVNVNTASEHVLQLIPGIDPSLAQAIVATRAGLDGVDGTEDDTPFATPGELINVPGMTREIVSMVGRFFTTRSTTFQVIVSAEMGTYKREFVAVVRRLSQRDVPTLFFYWK